MIQTKVSQRLPFFYGWVIVGIAVLVAPFFGSLTSWGLGVLVVPMEQELGWSRSMLFAPLAVGAMVSAVLGILVGPWLDRKRGPTLLFGAGVGGQLCRCTGYQSIIESVKLAAAKLRSGPGGKPGGDTSPPAGSRA